MTAPPLQVSAPVVGEIVDTELVEVLTSTGMTLEVQGDAEAIYYLQQQAKYTTEHKFQATTDLGDLDRLVFFELLNYRATSQLARGKRSDGFPLSETEEAALRRQIRDSAPLISGLKSDLGITKSQRDKEQYESVGSYLVNLRARAMEHGVHREKQLGTALALINQLFAMVGMFDRADEVERQKLGLDSADDLLDWIRTVMRPEYDAVDAHFRAHQQKAWVRGL